MVVEVVLLWTVLVNCLAGVVCYVHMYEIFHYVDAGSSYHVWCRIFYCRMAGLRSHGPATTATTSVSRPYWLLELKLTPRTR